MVGPGCQLFQFFLLQVLAADHLPVDGARFAANLIQDIVNRFDDLRFCRFSSAVGDVVSDRSVEQEDVAYATALGYIDGLLFGVASDNQAEAMERLQAFSESDACSRFVAVRVNSVAL